MRRSLSKSVKDLRNFIFDSASLQSFFSLLVFMISRHFLRISNDRHDYRFSLWQAPEVLDESRKLTTNVRLDDLLATLRADAGGNGLDNDQLSLKPKVLIDSFLFHLLAADVTFSVIVS